MQSMRSTRFAQSTRRRKAAGIAALVLGVILLLAGIIDHAVLASKSALCQSGLGQIGQLVDGTVAHDCGLVTAIESAVGWLLVAGILALILGAYVLYNSRTPPQPDRPAPPADPTWWPRP